MSDPLKSLEKAIKSLQEELQEQKEATTYTLSLLVLLAKELGLTKSRFSELSKEALKNLPKDLENQEFRKILKGFEES